MRPFLAAAAVVLSCATCCASPLRILILTGANNHDWRATTPVLKKILEDNGTFAVDIETDVPAMKPGAFAHYDAVLSNFNTFGKNNPAAAKGAVWGPEMRAAFVDFIRAGHGLIIVHAGSAGFYDWPEFQQIACATWGPGTSHGIMHTNQIHILPVDHPVTAGLKDFETYDEFWQHAQVAPGAIPLATVTPKPEFRGTGTPEPIAFASQFGKGRGFTLLLGHDTKGMESQGFQTLLRRGAEWAASGSVLMTASATPATASQPSK